MTGARDLVTDITPVTSRGWSVVRERGWVQCSPPGVTLPPAGWKVHVSAGTGHVTEVIDALRDVALEHGLVFKFLPTAEDALRSNSKGTLRSVSGKLGCIYADDRALGLVVADLRHRTRGIDGPDILTDLRCGPEPVFIRYGAYEEVWTFRDGLRRLGLRDPDGGVVVDEGRSRWTLPPWVKLPEWALPHVEERSARRTNLPCLIRRALHYSNAGGVYEGTMRDTGEVVLVKEGRPLTALDGEGVDAASRLEQEYHRLATLQATGRVPRVLGFHRGTRHTYLVREMLAGETVAQQCLTRWPWHGSASPDRAAVEAHEAWALGTLRASAELLDAVHAEGMLVHDLHPGNLFVTEGDGALKLFDLETLTEVSRRGLPPLIVPEYLAPSGVEGVERDDHAHRVLGHALFSPTVSGWQEEGRRAWVRRWISDHFGSAAVERLDTRTGAAAGQPIAEGVPSVLLEGGLARRAREGDLHLGKQEVGLGRGLAGVVLALALRQDTSIAPVHLERLRAVLPGLSRRDPSLATGAAGVALALARAGVDFDRDDWAACTAEHIAADHVEPHLWHGLAGVALTLGALCPDPGWDGGDALLTTLLPRLRAIRPGQAGGAGLLTGDAGLALAWSVLGRRGVPDADDRARDFLAPPPVGELPPTGGLEGVGGWFVALAAAPDHLLDAASDRAVALAGGGLRHRDGGLAHGLGGTLVGLAALEGRRSGAFTTPLEDWGGQATAWLAADGSSLHDAHTGGAADDLEYGTAGHVLAGALSRGGRRAP